MRRTLAVHTFLNRCAEMMRPTGKSDSGNGTRPFASLSLTDNQASNKGGSAPAYPYNIWGGTPYRCRSIGRTESSAQRGDGPRGAGAPALASLPSRVHERPQPARHERLLRKGREARGARSVAKRAPCTPRRGGARCYNTAPASTRLGRGGHPPVHPAVPTCLAQACSLKADFIQASVCS